MKLWFDKNIFHVKMFLFLLVLILLTLSVKSDIPTHCLKSQVVGEWIFSRTEATEKFLEDRYKLDNLCGHKLPSNQDTSINATKLNDAKQDLRVVFNNDDTANFKGTHEGEMGKWTMVYDEGFEFSISKNGKKETSYFAFLKFTETKSNTRITSKYSSHCYVTLNGWYKVGDKWGCFQGHKNIENYNDATNGEADNKQNITEDSIASDARKDNFTKKEEVDKQNFLSTVDSFSSNSIFSDNNLNSYDSFSNFIENKQTQRKQTSILDDQLNIYKLSEDTVNYKTPQYITNAINQSTSNFDNEFLNFKFTQSKTKFNDRLTLHSGFTDHDKFVERINSADLSWTAAVYEEFKGKTIEELNTFAGKKKNDMFLLGTNSNFNKKNKNYIKKYLSSNAFRMKFKKSVDMSNLILNVRSQGSCGSCYAASTLTMLEARLKKLYDVKKNISLDHVLECSVYNQGCDGGYSILVTKFGFENELLTEDCYTKGNKCKSSCEKSGKRIVIDDYYYVGGSYGKCDEASMIEELDKNGPYVISFEPSYDFMHYKSGIFESRIAKRSWLSNNSQKPEWQKVDHSVVLVGYGEEDGKKYWKLQNSWGKFWGENGQFRLIRGIDHLGIESICEAAKVRLE